MAYLEVVKGKDAGTQYTIRLDQPLTFGRDTEVIFLDDERASRKHFMVYGQADSFAIRDMGSKNGTFLNEKQVTIQKLKDGDVLRVGRIELAFKLEEKDPGWAEALEARKKAEKNARISAARDAVKEKEKDAGGEKEADAKPKSRRSLSVAFILSALFLTGVGFVWQLYLRQKAADPPKETRVVRNDDQKSDATARATLTSDADIKLFIAKAQTLLLDNRFRDLDEVCAILKNLKPDESLERSVLRMIDAGDIISLIELTPPVQKTYIRLTQKHDGNEESWEGFRIGQDNIGVYLLTDKDVILSIPAAEIGETTEITGVEFQDRMERQYLDTQRNFPAVSTKDFYFRAARFYRRGYPKHTGELVYEAVKKGGGRLARKVADWEIMDAGRDMLIYSYRAPTHPIQAWYDPARRAYDRALKYLDKYPDEETKKGLEASWARIETLKTRKENGELTAQGALADAKPLVVVGSTDLSAVEALQAPENGKTGEVKTTPESATRTSDPRKTKADPPKKTAPKTEKTKTIAVRTFEAQTVTSSGTDNRQPYSDHVTTALRLMNEAKGNVARAGNPSNSGYKGEIRQAKLKFEQAEKLIDAELGNREDSYLEDLLTDIGSQLFWIRKFGVD